VAAARERDLAHPRGPVHAAIQPRRPYEPGSRDNDDDNARPPDFVRAIAEAVRDRGGRALLVGGCVRDEILGRVPKDLDLEVLWDRRVRPSRPARSNSGAWISSAKVSPSTKWAASTSAFPVASRRRARPQRASSSRGDPDLSYTDAARRRDFTSMPSRAIR
jgi:tRNA nucleotidyltransferase (CCA-adding enzyme)